MSGSFTVRVARDEELGAAGEVVAAAYAPMPGMDEEPGYLEEVRDTRGRMADADILVAVDDDGVCSLAVLGVAVELRAVYRNIPGLDALDGASL